MYSARFQNREVYYLLLDCIALKIPDAPYSGMLTSLRLGLDCNTSIRVSIGTKQRTSWVNGVITHTDSSAPNRSGDYDEQSVLPM